MIQTPLIDFLEKLDDDLLTSFLDEVLVNDDQTFNVINEVCRFGSKNLLKKIIPPEKERKYEPTFLYNAILSGDLEKVKMVFKPEVFYDWTTKAVLRSTEEIYNYLMSKNVKLDFQYLALKPVLVA
jgi:hypothetical protein